MARAPSPRHDAKPLSHMPRSRGLRFGWGLALRNSTRDLISNKGLLSIIKTAEAPRYAG